MFGRAPRPARLPASILALVLGMGLAGPALALTVTPTSDLSIWAAPGYATTPDPSNDVTQTEADFVGNATDRAFYMAFDDQGDAIAANDELWFRARISGDQGAAGFSRVVLIGIDADGDAAIDLFVGVDNQGNPDRIRVWDTGVGLNTAPNNTTIVDSGISYALTASNYDWSRVSTRDSTMSGAADPRADLDASGTGEDMFLTFMVPFDTIVQRLALKGINVTAGDPLAYVLASSNQPNALNEDLSGTGAFSSSATYASLGVVSNAFAPVLVNEPTRAGLLAAALLGVGIRRVRSRG